MSSSPLCLSLSFKLLLCRILKPLVQVCECLCSVTRMALLCAEEVVSSWQVVTFLDLPWYYRMMKMSDLPRLRKFRLLWLE
ncbi:hypothetical protein CEXT_241541 [Caerostris extrusa]|uniref:Secreted protein n=1 Tax=Caerostris extrusa TaxID=172846 RepID=A0AAV4TNC2_CAEEX|nr:hypothetical protein CEXT_241541 [Caerostris extrusa]